MSEEYGLKFVVNGEDYDKIKKSLNEQIEDLQQKVKQLEKELQTNVKKCKQLENIRKEAIEYINKNWGHWCSNHCKYATETINILNKGDNNE